MSRKEVPRAGLLKAAPTTEKTGSIPPAINDQAIIARALVKPGESAEVTFEAPVEPGEYTFVSGFPGHFVLGMMG